MSRPVVTLHLWGVTPAAVPRAVGRMGLDRAHLARTPGLRFWKLLGTGDGRTFTARDADPRHWGVLAVWAEGAAAAEALPGGAAPRTWRRWRAFAEEELAVRMRPLAARGEWAGQRPFGDPVPVRTQGAVASITRARIRTRRARAFWRAVPPVSTDLHQVPGMRLAVGIGEAPVGLQGTFSLWDDAASLREFAHRRGPHVEVVRRTAEEDWYAEELFARFAVESVAGTYRGRRVEVRGEVPG